MKKGISDTVFMQDERSSINCCFIDSSVRIVLDPLALVELRPVYPQG